MAVKCLSTSLKLFESRRRKARRQKWRRGDWRRQERGTAVGMAGGRGGACISRCRKSGRKRGFPPSTGFPPRRRRPLLAISGIYTFTRTHIPLPALATLNLNLQTRIAPSPSSLTSLYVQRKAPL